VPEQVDAVQQGADSRSEGLERRRGGHCKSATVDLRIDDSDLGFTQDRWPAVVLRGPRAQGRFALQLISMRGRLRMTAGMEADTFSGSVRVMNR
jgi:hypothetical protein